MSNLLPRMVIALTALLGTLVAAFAQSDYPKQPIRIIVANTPGTAVDTLVRVLAPRMSQALGQQVYVENRAGAGGSIGAEAAARSAPDGYTILATSTPLQVIAPHLRKNLRYDPFNDFIPLTMFARTENVIIMHPPLPMKSVQDIIDFAKKHPGKLKMSNAGIGFQSHLANVMFTTMADIEVLHVPYKGASSSNSVMTGESDLTISPLPSVFSMIKAGSVRPVAVTGLQRSPVAPDLPTINETGVPGYQASGWSGFVLPKGTPKPIVDKLTDAMVVTLNDPETRDQLLRAGGEPWLLTGSGMGKVMQEEFERYGDVIRKAKITLD
jgi:tripartite-type tricarboxylate transporter receptor subunit TctC